MKESIKKRIEAVRRGEVPDGYRIENGYLISDDWKTVPLNSRFTKSTRKNGTGCENVLTISAQMGLVNQREFYDKDIASKDKSGYFLMKNGEFAYNKSYSTGYPYGAIKQLTKYDEGIVSPLYICFAPKAGTNTAFYTQYFEGGRYNREIYRVAQEGARNHGLLNIAVEDFFTGILVEPSAGEQQKIAKILATCDRMIELKQSKIDELNKLKQICLLEMFPQKGQTIPQRRFPGFSAPWEQRKLGEVVQITMGQSPDGSTYSDEPSDYILVQGNADLQNGWVCPRIWTTQVTKKADAGDLIMSVRAPAGAMGKTAYNAVIGRGVAAIKGNEFIYQLLVKMDTDGFWKALSCGSTFESLNSDNIKNAEIIIPSKEEQEQIGAYLQKLDNLITLHQCELADVGKYKKALMQILLTGLVRVNA